MLLLSSMQVVIDTCNPYPSSFTKIKDMLSSILTRMRPAGRIHVLERLAFPAPTRSGSACCGVLDLLGPPSLSSAAKLEAGGSRRGAGPPIGLLSRAIEFIPAAICVVGEGVTVAAEMAALGGKPDRFFAAPDKFNSILVAWTCRLSASKISSMILYRDSSLLQWAAAEVPSCPAVQLRLNRLLRAPIQSQGCSLCLNCWRESPWLDEFLRKPAGPLKINYMIDSSSGQSAKPRDRERPRLVGKTLSIARDKAL